MENNLKKNIILIAILAYLLTFVTGAVNVIPFVIKAPATKFFHSTAEITGFAFGVFMFGYLIGICINGFIVKYIKPRYEILLTTVIYSLCSIYIMFIVDVNVLYIPILIMGLGIGMIYTIPNYLIVSTFEGHQRSANMNRVDFCYSLGSLAYPMIAGFMLSHNGTWQQVFLSVIIVLVIIIIISFLTKLPNLHQGSHGTVTGETVKYSKWNLNVYIVAIAIFFYLLSYMGFTYWVVEYVTKSFHLKMEAAFFGISLFWIFYAVGCFISSIVVSRISVHKYIIFSGIVAIIAYGLIFVSSTTMMFYFSISLLGLACATIFSSSISLGTLFLKNPSPNLISFFIGCATVGSIVAEYSSSFIQSAMGVAAVIVFSAVFMIVTVVLMILLLFRKKV